MPSCFHITMASSGRPAAQSATDARRYAAMKILATIVLFISFAASANQTEIIDGNYLRYEGSQYESMFFPCQSTEVWSINGGIAFEALVDYYRNSRMDTTGEIRTSLMVHVFPINKVEHPSSQIDAVATVLAVVSLTEDEDVISSCRE